MLDFFYPLPLVVRQFYSLYWLSANILVVLVCSDVIYGSTLVGLPLSQTSLDLIYEAKYSSSMGFVG